MYPSVAQSRGLEQPMRCLYENVHKARKESVKRTRHSKSTRGMHNIKSHTMLGSITVRLMR